jgi:hypothetical protein
MSEVKMLEEKHRSVSDPETMRRAANLQKFNLLMANPALRPRDLAGPQMQMPNQNYNQPPYVPIVIQQPNVRMDDDKIKELQMKLAGVESDNKKLEEQIRNALIIENPRLIQAFYPAGRPFYNTKSLLNAALEAEIDKTRQESQMFSKLRDIYGEDAASKYLERSLNRIKEARYEAPKYEYTPTPIRQPRTRSKSPKKASSKTKSSKAKKPTKAKSPVKNKKK